MNIQDLLNELSHKAHLSDAQLSNIDKTIKNLTYDDVKNIFDDGVKNELPLKDLYTKYKMSSNTLKRFFNQYKFVYPLEFSLKRASKGYKNLINGAVFHDKNPIIIEKRKDIKDGMTFNVFLEKWGHTYKTRASAFSYYSSRKKK